MENDLRFLGRSDESPAVLAARVRRRRPDARAARRAADAARHGGQAHRALGRRLGERRRGRAAHGREAPARRPPLPHDRHARRRRRAAVDRVRRDEHRPRPAHPGRPAGRGPARQPAHRAHREDGRRQQRHAVLGRRAPAHRRRRRDPHPAGRHAARRPARRPVRRRRARRRRQAEPRRRALDPRPRARGRRGDPAQVRWPEPVVEEGSGPSTAERLAVEVARPRPVPAVRRALGERRPRRPVARPRSRCACSPPASARSATSSTRRTT